MQIVVKMFLLLFDAAVGNKVADAAPVAFAKMVPDEAELALRFVEERCLDLFTIQLAIVVPEVIEVGRTGDLQEIRKVAADLDYPSGVSLEREARFRRGLFYELQRLGAGERPKKYIREDIEEW